MDMGTDLLDPKSSSAAKSRHSQRRIAMPTWKKVFNLVPSIRIHWPRYRADYELLQRQENGVRKPTKRRLPMVKLGNSRKGFMVRIYRRFRVRVFKGYCWALFRRLKALYFRLIAELNEAAPGMEMINSSALINAHFSISALPPTVPSMAF